MAAEPHLFQATLLDHAIGQLARLDHLHEPRALDLAARRLRDRLRLDE